MQELRRTSGLFGTPEKAKVRRPLLILSPLLGTPENVGLRPPVVIFSPLLGTPRECNGHVAISASFCPPRRQGGGSHF